jgi:hypothetical protein
LAWVLAAWVLAGLGGAAIAAEPLIWVEGEQAGRTQLVDNAGLNDVNPDELSGGKWVCSFSHEQEPTGTAEYAVEITEAGQYHLWVRAVGGTGLAYRLDGAKDAVDVAIDKGKDPIPVAADGNPFYPPAAAWYDLGLVDLTRGGHTITWYLGGLKEKVRWGGMDCFVLTTGAFTPNGKYKPGQKSPEPIPAFKPGQTWDFVPQADKLDPAAVLDLRYLNEKVAGEHGFIRLSPDGDSFVRGDGQPIRFWAASPGFEPEVDLAARKHDAQFLAKRGVNFARVWCNLFRTVEGSKITDVDEKALDDLFKTVAAMKAAGIYLTINPYWAVSVKLQKTPIISEESGWDPNRDTGNITLASSVKTTLDPLAYLVGAVRVAYDGDPAKTEVADLAKHIDREHKTVRSITAQIETDYGKGVYRVNAPTAQAVAGFLRDAGPQRLADVEIVCRNQYASIVLAPLDGKPIRLSGKLLVQAGTVCRPTGWTAAPTRARINGKQSNCFRILSAGKAPFQVENTEATITVANGNLTKGILLDVNGMATPTPVQVNRADGKAMVVLPANTMYLVLE